VEEEAREEQEEVNKEPTSQLFCPLANPYRLKVGR